MQMSLVFQAMLEESMLWSLHNVWVIFSNFLDHLTQSINSLIWKIPNISMMLLQALYVGVNVYGLVDCYINMRWNLTTLY